MSVGIFRNFPQIFGRTVGVSPSIVIVLAREDNVIQVGWMTVRNRVLIGIPAPVAKIKATHECRLAIYNTQLFVMSPMTKGISRKLQSTQ